VYRTANTLGNCFLSATGSRTLTFGYKRPTLSTAGFLFRNILCISSSVIYSNVINIYFPNARLENDRLESGLILFFRHRSTARTALPVTRWGAQFDSIETSLLLGCNQQCAV